MLSNNSILAIVPARSGSKGVPDKNMHQLGGVSLIGRAGQTLEQLSFIDARIISTDSLAYAEEGRRYGLDALFLRPPELSADGSAVIDATRHALTEAEMYYARRFDIILLVEPTSPLRKPGDIEGAISLLLETQGDSVVTVSSLSTQSHPYKLLTISNRHLDFYLPAGKGITARQQLTGNLYWRNGVCYALTRACVVDYGQIFTSRTFPMIIDRPIVNIDTLLDLEWAEFLLSKTT